MEMLRKTENLTFVSCFYVHNFIFLLQTQTCCLQVSESLNLRRESLLRLLVLRMGRRCCGFSKHGSRGKNRLGLR